MSEWPKKLLVDEPPHDDPMGELRRKSVIPADLGRELYEAASLSREPIIGEREYVEAEAERRMSLIEAALARYEREVGE